MYGDSVYRGLAWLPLCTSGIGLATILITYMLAVGYGHILPLLPYISDTGIEYPESSVFSLCMDIEAFMLTLTVYISYLLIGQFNYRNGDLDKTDKRLRRVNQAGLVVGCIAAAGLTILANFPEDENLPIHLMGAFFCFTFGVAYCFIHSWLSFQMCPDFNSPLTCFLQLSLAAFSALTLILCVLFGGVLRWNADENNPQPFFKKISAVFEWTLVVTLDLYFATFALEFRRIRITHMFHHYKRGSWVEFTPFTRGRASPGHSEDSGSRRNSNISNTNYTFNNQNVCQHNNKMAQVFVCQDNRTTHENVCQQNKAYSLVCQHSHETTLHNVCRDKRGYQNLGQQGFYTSLQNVCQHQNGTANILPTVEWCICGSRATTV